MKAVNQTTSPIFAAALKQSLLAHAVRVYLANTRQATAKTKTRSEINRTKKKWFKQKGTGNARHGAQTPGIFVGGGVAHGPHGVQNFSLKLPKELKRQALLTALTLQAPQSYISDEILTVDGKTKSAVKVLGDKLTNEKRVLVVVKEKTPAAMRSFANLEMVFLTTAANLDLLTVVRAHVLIFTQDSLQILAERLIKKEKVALKKPSPAPVTPTAAKIPASIPAKKPAPAKVTTTIKRAQSKKATPTQRKPRRRQSKTEKTT
jgi:large subunit ribosomal protein L4